MEQKKLSEFTDDELLAEAKKARNTAILNAFLIGFLIGIIVFSVVVNSIGFLTLIPLYLIYRLANNPENAKNQKELQALLKARNLK